VDKIYSKPWLGVVTGSIISAGVFPFILFFKQDAIAPSWDILILCIITGIIIQLSQFYYFRALDYSDCGTVSAYWNLTPTFLPVISYWLFGYLITGNNYIGIGLLILGSVGLCLNDSFADRWNTLYLMTIAASLQTVVILLEKYIFEHTNFSGAFIAISVSMFASGLLTLSRREVRVSLICDLLKIRAAMPILIAIEVVNLTAMYVGQLAVKSGVPSLVSAIEATIPAFAFVLTLGIDLHNRRFRFQPQIPLKLSMIALMMVGVWLIGARIEA
jgi:drug/metabolite transporter (DMT)-like permease